MRFGPYVNMGEGRPTGGGQVRLVGEHLLDLEGHLLQRLGGSHLQGEAVQQGLAAAQQVGLQHQRHPLAKVGAGGHLAAHVPEEEVSDPLALW